MQESVGVLVNYLKINIMGTVLAIMGGYYILSGQAFKAAGEAAKWIDEMVNQSNDKKK